MCFFSLSLFTIFFHLPGLGAPLPFARVVAKYYTILIPKLTKHTLRIYVITVDSKTHNNRTLTALLM